MLEQPLVSLSFSLLYMLNRYKNALTALLYTKVTLKVVIETFLLDMIQHLCMADRGKTHLEILEIKEKLSEMHNDLKRFIERSNQDHLESILANTRKDYANVIIGHIVEDIEVGLESNMVKRCEMRDTCKSNFSTLLQDNVSLIKHNNVPEDTILKNRSELKEMKDNAPFKRCDKCFSEVSSLLRKQVNLMHSMQIYNTDEEEKQDISKLPDELLVKGILEPTSNKHRLQILRAVSIETKNFSALSGLTGLRGGNLLFHLQKLLDSEMILQRHERGDYLITGKGFKVLKGLSDIYSALKSSK